MPETTGLIDKTAMSSMNVEIVKQLVDYFQGQTPQYTVNPEAASQHTVFFGPICPKIGLVLSLYVLNMHQLLTFRNIVYT